MTGPSALSVPGAHVDHRPPGLDRLEGRLQIRVTDVVDPEPLGNVVDTRLGYVPSGRS